MDFVQSKRKSSLLSVGRQKKKKNRRIGALHSTESLACGTPRLPLSDRGILSVLTDADSDRSPPQKIKSKIVLGNKNDGEKNFAATLLTCSHLVVAFFGMPAGVYLPEMVQDDVSGWAAAKGRPCVRPGSATERRPGFIPFCFLTGVVCLSLGTPRC